LIEWCLKYQLINRQKTLFPIKKIEFTDEWGSGFGRSSPLIHDMYDNFSHIHVNRYNFNLKIYDNKLWLGCMVE
jgi:hypothetical protein